MVSYLLVRVSLGRVESRSRPMALLVGYIVGFSTSRLRLFRLGQMDLPDILVW